MALRTDRPLNHEETVRIHWFTTQLNLDCGLTQGMVAKDIYEARTSQCRARLGDGFYEAAEATLAAFRKHPEALLQLTRPNHRRAVIALYDTIEAARQHRAGAIYIASLTQDPQALADALQSATGAREVAVRYDTRNSEGTLRIGQVAIARRRPSPEEIAERINIDEVM